MCHPDTPLSPCSSPCREQRSQEIRKFSLRSAEVQNPEQGSYLFFQGIGCSGPVQCSQRLAGSPYTHGIGCNSQILGVRWKGLFWNRSREKTVYFWVDLGAITGVGEVHWA